MLFKWAPFGDNYSLGMSVTGFDTEVPLFLITDTASFILLNSVLFLICPILLLAGDTKQEFGIGTGLIDSI